jgi:hypothetical protein
MKILIIVLLCLMTLMMGCSRSFDQASSLWEERKMDDDRRIYGNPYDSPSHWQSVWLPTPY